MDGQDGEEPVTGVTKTRQGTSLDLSKFCPGPCSWSDIAPLPYLFRKQLHLYRLSRSQIPKENGSGERRRQASRQALLTPHQPSICRAVDVDVACDGMSWLAMDGW